MHRDARLQRNREREEAARAREEWRERRERRPSAIEDEDLDDEDELEDARDDRGTAADAARLHLQVSPGDASVYLDGNFLGTGSELQQLSAGLVVAPGAHTLQVVRPGYESEDVSFDSDPGEALELNVTLDRE